MEHESSVRAPLVRGLRVGVTGPSLPYGLDSTLNWEKDEEYSHARHVWNRKNEVLLLAPEV